MEAREMIDRYVYAVTRRLPDTQRADIEKELRALIEDMLAKERQSHPEADDAMAAEAVLRSLGSPAALAAGYRGTGQYLIGPEYYPLYTLVLRIVLIATAIGLTVALVVSLFNSATAQPLALFSEMLGRIVTGLIGAFGWVTLIFVAIERYSPEDALKANKELEAGLFHPRNLPPVPHGRDRIPPSDPIAAIIFTLIGMIFVFFIPRFLGLYTNGPAGGMVPLFNEPIFRIYMPFILGLMALGISREVGKLAVGRWSVPLTLYHLALGAAGVILTIAMFSHPDLFNPAFFDRALALVNASDPMLLGLPLAQFLPRVIIVVSVFGYLVDVIVAVVRMITRTVRA